MGEERACDGWESGVHKTFRAFCKLALRSVSGIDELIFSYKGVQLYLSRTQAGPGREVKNEQDGSFSQLWTRQFRHSITILYMVHSKRDHQ